MWLETHSDIEGRPSYTVIPEDISDAFRQICHDNGVEVELERGVFRSDGKSYDFGTFRNNAMEDVRDIVEEWNREQRRASRQRAGKKQ